MKYEHFPPVGFLTMLRNLAYARVARSKLEETAMAITSGTRTKTGLFGMLVFVLSLTSASMGQQGAQAGAYDDHQNMMDQLKITALRPGKNGQNQTGKGFDLASANEMMPSLPDALVFRNGTKVTTPAQWQQRRAEIVED